MAASAVCIRLSNTKRARVPNQSALGELTYSLNSLHNCSSVVRHSTAGAAILQTHKNSPRSLIPSASLNSSIPSNPFDFFELFDPFETLRLL